MEEHEDEDMLEILHQISLSDLEVDLLQEGDNPIAVPSLQRNQINLPPENSGSWPS
jgi:elongation factor P hydroxylase